MGEGGRAAEGACGSGRGGHEKGRVRQYLGWGMRGGMRQGQGRAR